MFAKKGLSAVPAVFVKDPAGSKACLLELAKKYEEDLPADQDLSTLLSEIDGWRHQLESMPRTIIEETDTVAKALVLASESGTYPGLVRLLALVCTWPVTTASCERSISVLRTLKSYMRSTIGQDRLTGLAMLHVHYSRLLSHDAVLAQFLSAQRCLLVPRLTESVADVNDEEEVVLSEEDLQ